MKSILVHADRRPSLRARLDTAKALAKGAGHLTVLIDTPLLRYINCEPMGAGLIAAEAMREAIEEDDGLAAEIHAELTDSGLSFQVLRGEADPVPMLAHLARLADVVVLSRDCGMAGDVACEARAPVLVLDDRHPLPLPLERACIAWDGGGEAALALRHALPLLAPCASVSLITIDEKCRGFSVDDALAFLARSGVKAERIARSRVRTVEETIATTAHELGAQLLVMGAYGHSRMREYLLGGATSYFIEETSGPALFLSH